MGRGVAVRLRTRATRSSSANADESSCTYWRGSRVRTSSATTKSATKLSVSPKRSRKLSTRSW